MPCSCSRQLYVFSSDIIGSLPKELLDLVEETQKISGSNCLRVGHHQRATSENMPPKCFLAEGAYQHLVGYFAGTETVQLGDPNVMGDARSWWKEFCEAHSSQESFEIFYNPLIPSVFQDASNIKGVIQENRDEPTFAHSLMNLTGIRPQNKIVIIAPERRQNGTEVGTLRSAIWLMAGQNPKRTVEEIIIAHSDGAIARDFHKSLYESNKAPAITTNVWCCSLEDLLPDNGTSSKLKDAAFLLIGCPLADPKDEEQVGLERSLFANWSSGRRGKQGSLVLLANDEEVIQTEGYLRSILGRVVTRGQVREQYLREKAAFFDGISRSHYATCLFAHARTLGMQVDAARIARAVNNLGTQGLAEIVPRLVTLGASEFKGAIQFYASGRAMSPFPQEDGIVRMAKPRKGKASTPQTFATAL